MSTSSPREFGGTGDGVARVNRAAAYREKGEQERANADVEKRWRRFFRSVEA
jgi:hypothetical protein